MAETKSREPLTITTIAKLIDRIVQHEEKPNKAILFVASGYTLAALGKGDDPADIIADISKVFRISAARCFTLVNDLERLAR